MKNNMEHKSIQENIIESIKSGKVHMKPRWYFVLRFVLNILLVCLVFFVTVYLLSFIGLVLREKELFNLFDLSPGGMKMLMTSIPWVIVMLSISLVMVLYVLVRDHSFVYKKPVAYIFSGLVLLVILIGFVIHILDVNFRFARLGEDIRNPLMGPMHKYYRGDIKDKKKMERFDRRMEKMRKEAIQ